MLAAAAGNADSVAELTEQYRLMQLKRMLLRYGIRVVNISDMSMAKRLVRAIVGHPTQPSAAVIQDAMQVVSAYHHLTPHDVYTARLRQLAQWGRLTVSDVAEIAGALPPAEATAVVAELLAYLADVVEDHVVALPSVADVPEPARLAVLESEAAVAEVLKPIQAALALATYADEHKIPAALQGGAAPDEAVAWRWSAMQMLVAEFNVATTWATLRSAPGRRAVVTAFAMTPGADRAGRVAVDADRKPASAGASVRLQRLAKMLLIPQPELLALLAKSEAQLGRVRGTLERCQVHATAASGVT